jgi:hypothetical protein
VKEPGIDEGAVVGPGQPMTDLDQEIADILNAADMHAMQAISTAWEQGTAAALAAAGLEGKLPAVLHAGLKVAAPAVTAAAAAAVEGLSGLSPSACSALLNIGCLALSNKLAVMPPSDHQQIVDDVMRRMMQMFAADREAADMTLGCLIDFVYRRLVGNMSPGVVQQVGGAGAATGAAAAQVGGVVGASGGSGAGAAGSSGSLVIEYTVAANAAAKGPPGGGGSSSGSGAGGSEIGVRAKQSDESDQSSVNGAAAARSVAGASSSASSGPTGQSGTGLLASTSILQIPQGANVKLVEQFLAVPQVVFQQPEVLRQALYCLSPADLQMVLAYVVQQHTNALAQVEESGSEPDTSSEATCREDEPGCCPLFHLYLLNEATFEQLVERVWPGEMGQHGGVLGGGAAIRGGGGGGLGKGGGSSGGVQGKVAAARGKLVGSSSTTNGSSSELAAAIAGGLMAGTRGRRLAGAAAGDKGTSATGVKGLGGLDLVLKGGKGVSKKGARPMGKDEQPYLMPADWWMSHFKEIARYEENKEEGDMRVLRWVYGNVVSSQAEEFLGRQQQLRGNLDRKEAVLQQYEALANCWRRVRALMDKRAKLELLHSNIKEHFALAKQLEEGGEHCTPEQACSFLEALFTSLCATNAAQQQQLLGAVGASGGQTAAAMGLPGMTTLIHTTTAAGAGTTVTGIPAGLPAAVVGAALPGGGNLLPPPSLRLPATPVGPYLGAPEGVLTVAAAAEEALQAELGNHQAAVQQLQVRLNQLAPLYLCEPAVEVVRSAPALARNASQQYAHALLARELAVLELVEAMLEDEGSGARIRQMEAQERMAARRAEMSAAEAEHARVLAEGPASHRKKDMLDKATKEAEHREKLADLLAKIDAARESIAADEVAAEAAASAATELAADLARAREQAQQIAARKKNLEDLNAQLSAPVPQLALAAAAAAGGSAGAAGYPMGFHRSLPQLVMAVEGLPMQDGGAGGKGEGGKVQGQMSCSVHPALAGVPLPSVSISATLVATGDAACSGIAAASSSCALPLGPVALPAGIALPAPASAAPGGTSAPASGS